MAQASETKQSIGGPVERAAGEVDHLARKEIELTRTKQLRTRELSEAEHGAGLAYLEERSTSFDQVIRLRAEIDAIGNAVKTCRTARLEAIKNKFLVIAQQAQREAAEKQGELEKLVEKTTIHLQALSSLENVPYSAYILSCQPAGDLTIHGNHTPKSERLRAEISQLKRRAWELENKKISNAGELDLDDQTNVDTVLIGTLMHESDGPSAQEILSWAEACQAAALKLRGVNAQFGELPRRYRLVWSDGKIDLLGSYVFVKDLAPAFTSALGEARGFDVAAATFRSTS